MEEVFGCHVPVCYVSKHAHTAAGYPMHQELWTKKGVSGGQQAGGELVARDGTPPLRCYVRCLGRSAYQLWHKSDGGDKNNQHGFRPDDLFITHIYIYACPGYYIPWRQLKLSWTLADVDGTIVEPAGKTLTERSIAFASGPPAAWSDRLKANPSIALAYPVQQDEEVPVDMTKKDLIEARALVVPILALREHEPRSDLSLSCPRELLRPAGRDMPMRWRDWL